MFVLLPKCFSWHKLLIRYANKYYLEIWTINNSFATQVAYYLDEHKSGWTVNVEELETIVHKAKDNCEPRAIVVINPGNPTGTYVFIFT